MTMAARYTILVLLAGAVAAIVQIVAVSNPAYPDLWTLPAAFVAATSLVLVTGRRREKSSWLEQGLIALWFIRLVGIPLLMIAAGNDYLAIGPSPTADEYRLGIRYMAYEVVVTSMVLVVARAYAGRRSAGRAPQEPSPEGGDLSFRQGSYVPQTALILAGMLALAFPGVRERFSFFTSAITGTAREIASGYDPTFSALASLANLARLAVPAVLITLALRGYWRRQSLAYPMLAALGCVAVNLFYVATSRASFFVPLAASIIVLAVAFPVARRRVLVWAGAALIIATLVVTQNKSFAESSQSTLGDAANYASTYLMGPKEYAVGIRAIEDYGSLASPATFMGDVLGNVPIISESVDPAKRTSQFYNWTYLGVGTHIVGGGFIAPASIQSAFYIGWGLGPLATAAGLIPAVLALRYLRRARQDPSMSYVAAFALVVALLFHTNTFSTIVAFFAFPILPLALLSLADGWLHRSAGGEAKIYERNPHRFA